MVKLWYSKVISSVLRLRFIWRRKPRANKYCRAEGLGTFRYLEAIGDVISQQDFDDLRD